MANENMIQFLRGNVANLPKTATEGAIYFTKDEGVYLGLADGSYHRYGDFITVADVNSLPASGAHATCMYYCVAENILAKYDATKAQWIQINKQPTADELKTLLNLDAKADKTYVGTLPTTEAYKDIDNVVAYIDKKAEETLAAAQGGSSETAASVKQQLDTYKAANDTRVKTIEDDYLKAADKEALETSIAGKQDIIPANTYDAYGAAATAEANAKAYVDAEDKFEVDMLTVNAHGGVAAGEDLNGMTTHDILRKILYPYVAFVINSSSRSAAAATLENGATQTLNSATISVTKKSKPITSIKLFNGSTVLGEKTGDEVAAGGSFTFNNLGITVSKSNNPNLKFTVTDGQTSTDKNVGASTFVYPYYMGECAADATIDETLVEGLTKKVESRGNKTVTHSCENGRMIIAYPKAHGVLKSILDPNNFETIGDYTRSEVSITGLDGTAQTYYVYASGAATVNGFKVQYKY